MKKMKKEVKRDRISELPEEIKEKIVSSLCMKDAIRTSSLSSVWRYTWVSLPFLDFGYHFYCKFTCFFCRLPANHPKKRHLHSILHDEGKEKKVGDDFGSTVDDTVDDSDIDYWFSVSDSDSDSDSDYDCDSDVAYLQMLDEFMQVYIEKNQCLGVLKKMSLFVPILFNSKMRDYGADIVSRCLSLAKHNVTELDYHIDNFGRPHYPKDSYRALQNCLPILESKTLTKLVLKRCYLARGKKVDLPIDLPNLKHLSLIMFNVDKNMLETLLAKCPALKKLKFSLCKRFKVIRIPRVSKLKELEVMQMRDLDLLEINAMSLQCLVLIDCPELKHIKITSNSLTRFEVKDCPNLSRTVLDTPKLIAKR